VSEFYEPSNAIGLPTPYDLTGDAAWDEGADLWTKYDLALEAREGIKADSGIKVVLREGLNTLEGSEPINIMGQIVADNEGIKVFSQDLAMEKQNMETEEMMVEEESFDPPRDPAKGIMTI
jgi:hypothetical protein